MKDASIIQGSIGELEQLVSTPLVVRPGMNRFQLEREAKNLIERSNAAGAFLKGQITWDDYLSIMDSHKIDAVDFDEMIRSGAYAG